MSSVDDHGRHDGQDRDGQEAEERRKRRNELLFRVGMAVALLAFVIFIISIAEDPGPVCGTGQDKGPC